MPSSIFKYFLSEESPLVRVVDPAIFIWNHDKKAVMNFSYNEGYTTSSTVLESPLKKKDFRDVLLKEFEKVLNNQDYLEIRDYNADIHNKPTQRDISTNNQSQIIESIYKYFKI